MEKAIILGNRVKEIRNRLGIRQVDLANEVGVARQTIIAIEKRRLNPSITLCLKIARVLREPVDYVFYLDRAPDTAEQEKGRPEQPTPKPKQEPETPQSVFDFD